MKKIITSKILMQWIGISTLGILIGQAIGAKVGETVGFALGDNVGNLLNRMFDISSSETLSSAIAGLVSGLVGGSITGSSQWLVMRRLLDKSGLWIINSAFGLAIGGFVSSWITQIEVSRTISIEFPSNSTFAMGGVVTGLSVGFLQWMLLRQKFPKAIWWVITNIFGSVVAVLLVSSAYRYVSGANFEDFLISWSIALVSSLASALLFAVITGGALVVIAKNTNDEAVQMLQDSP